MTLTAEGLKAKLEEALKTREQGSVEVLDISSGCGTSFEVKVVSPEFEGKNLLARHRLINDILKNEMPHIHALSIKQAQTPAQAQGS
ncbi:bola protein [Dunaliella salina]|uniref:Bola protein n=1 Tax=Dunaliella salina TaxID=3046 RepID=A0ABQ7H7I7_DUNSA|nr:bola protein [Dunaliella salina]|eukprot:KAF5842821.1 bola protein [Dunaliella salina]